MLGDSAGGRGWESNLSNFRGTPEFESKGEQENSKAANIRGAMSKYVDRARMKDEALGIKLAKYLRKDQSL